MYKWTFYVISIKTKSTQRSAMGLQKPPEIFHHNREGVNFENTAIYKFEGMPLMKHPRLRLINWDHM